jgi:hypothetical protein
VTRYVLADLQEVRNELTRRAAELTAWLDKAAAEYHPPGEPAPGMAMGDLACVQAVSAAAARLTAAADAVAACARDVEGTDRDLADRLCRWSP